MYASDSLEVVVALEVVVVLLVELDVEVVLLAEVVVLVVVGELVVVVVLFCSLEMCSTAVGWIGLAVLYDGLGAWLYRGLGAAVSEAALTIGIGIWLCCWMILGYQTAVSKDCGFDQVGNACCCQFGCGAGCSC